MGFASILKLDTTLIRRSTGLYIGESLATKEGCRFPDQFYGRGYEGTTTAPKTSRGLLIPTLSQVLENRPSVTFWVVLSQALEKHSKEAARGW
jgi:hypothetical protein